MEPDSKARLFALIGVFALVCLFDLPSVVYRWKRWSSNATPVSHTTVAEIVMSSVPSSTTELIHQAEESRPMERALEASDTMVDKRDATRSDQYNVVVDRDRTVRKAAARRLAQALLHNMAVPKTALSRWHRGRDASQLQDTFEQIGPKQPPFSLPLLEDLRNAEADGTIAKQLLLCQVFRLTYEDFRLSVFGPTQPLHNDSAVATCSLFETQHLVNSDVCSKLEAFSGVALLRGDEMPQMESTLRDVYVSRPLRTYVEAEANASTYLFQPFDFRSPASSSRNTTHPHALTVVNATRLLTTLASPSDEALCLPPRACDHHNDDAACMTRLRKELNDASHSPAMKSSASWSGSKLRIAYLTDLLSVIGLADRERQPGYQITDAAENVCMTPKLRAILRFNVFNRWMLDQFEPPLTEDDVIDTVEGAWNQLRNLSNDGGSAPNTDFSASFNYRSPKMMKRASARNQPAFFYLHNTVIPSSPFSGPPEGHSMPTRQYSLSLMRDERWIHVRQFDVVARSTKPRFVVRKKQLFLFPAIFASNNIGHVMFRFYSIRALMEKLRMQNPQDCVFVYVAVPSAALTFGPSNIYRAFYQAQHGPWGSILSDSVASSRFNPHHQFDLCFARGVSGFGGVAQFHRGHTAVMIASRIQSLQRLLPAFHSMRRASEQCLQLSAATRSPQDPLMVVVIRRRRRKLIDDEELVLSYLRNASNSIRPDGDHDGATTEYVVDPLTQIPLRITMVTLEFLTIRQQIDLVRRADVLFGAMGAGLCWMMFMKRFSAVVELHSSITMHCTGVGINADRMRCDYSKQSVAADLNHIGFPLYVKDWCPPLRCDGRLSQFQFNQLMATSLCTVGKTASVAQAQCARYFPAVTNASQMAEQETVAATSEKRS